MPSYCPTNCLVRRDPTIDPKFRVAIGLGRGNEILGAQRAVGRGDRRPASPFPRVVDGIGMIGAGLVLLDPTGLRPLRNHLHRLPFRRLEAPYRRLSIMSVCAAPRACQAPCRHGPERRSVEPHRGRRGTRAYALKPRFEAATDNGCAWASQVPEGPPVGARGRADLGAEAAAQVDGGDEADTEGDQAPSCTPRPARGTSPRPPPDARCSSSTRRASAGRGTGHSVIGPFTSSSDPAEEHLSTDEPPVNPVPPIPEGSA